MALIITGGLIKGHKILTPPEDTIRPMSIRLKRRIFDAYQTLEGYHFIDLCTGSGAIGLEAWSRDARKITLIEKEKKVFSITQKNLDSVKAKCSEDIKIRTIDLINQDCLIWIKTFKEKYETFSDEEKVSTILFLAPPYAIVTIYEIFLTFIKDWFKGQVWVESDRQKGLTIEAVKKLLEGSDLKYKKDYLQGSTFILIFKT